MRICLFGASGQTGRYILQESLSQGHSVTALVRTPSGLGVIDDHLRLIQGDAYDLAAVEQAVRGCQVVISVLGAPYSFKPITIYSMGTANIIEAMRKSGVRRLLCTSSGAANPHYEPQEGIFFGVLFKNTYGRTLYIDMRAMEQAVAATDVDWTIVRPAQLIETASVTSYRLGPGYLLSNGTKTSRRDLADFMLREATANRYVRQHVAIATDVAVAPRA
jgi:putative NADH-flavin reductase